MSEMADGFATRLRDAGLRPTRQRIAIARTLFARGHRHISAEVLHDEAAASSLPVSLATIYNTLHHFTAAGLIRQVTIGGGRTYFDTNASEHHHFFVEGENRLIDLVGDIKMNNSLEPPDGMEMLSVEVVVRIRKIRD